VRRNAPGTTILKTVPVLRLNLSPTMSAQAASLVAKCDHSIRRVAADKEVHGKQPAAADIGVPLYDYQCDPYGGDRRSAVQILKAENKRMS